MTGIDRLGPRSRPIPFQDYAARCPTALPLPESPVSGPKSCWTWWQAARSKQLIPSSLLFRRLLVPGGSRGRSYARTI